ncbi:MAG: OmpA family protein [Massilia sp.]
MKLNTIPALMTVLAVSLLAPGAASADDDEFVNPDWADHAWYLGASIGKTRSSIDQADLSQRLSVSGQGPTTFNKDEKDRGFKFFLGKQLNHHWALEAGYFDLGKATFDTTVACGCKFSGEYGFRGVNLDLVGALTLSQRAALLGRVGAIYGETKAHFSDARLGVGPDLRPRGYGGKAGLGLEYKLSEAFALRAEAERYHLPSVVGHDGRVDLFSIGLVVKLGRPDGEAPPPVIAPPVYTPPPPPAELPPPPPPPLPPAPPLPQVPVSEKVSFAAEALFDFDKAVIKPAGKTALDGLLRGLAGMNLEVIIMVGHTDSIGTEAYNQKLSLRRVQAVKAYMAEQGIDPTRIYAEGKGETQPVADNRTAAGRALNRRVTLEVVGTRSAQ